MSDRSEQKNSDAEIKRLRTDLLERDEWIRTLRSKLKELMRSVERMNEVHPLERFGSKEYARYCKAHKAAEHLLIRTEPAKEGT